MRVSKEVALWRGAPTTSPTPAPARRSRPHGEAVQPRRRRLELHLPGGVLDGPAGVAAPPQVPGLEVGRIRRGDLEPPSRRCRGRPRRQRLVQAEAQERVLACSSQAVGAEPGGGLEVVGGPRLPGPAAPQAIERPQGGRGCRGPSRTGTPLPTGAGSERKLQGTGTRMAAGSSDTMRIWGSDARAGRTSRPDGGREGSEPLTAGTAAREVSGLVASRRRPAASFP